MASADHFALLHAGGSGSPDSTIQIALDVDNLGPRAGITFEIVFDPAIVEPGAIQLANRGQAFRGSAYHQNSDTTLAGVLVDDVGSQLLMAGRGTILTMPFHILPTVGHATPFNLRIRKVMAADSIHTPVDNITTEDLMVVVLDVPTSLEPLPTRPALMQSRPNPFSGTATIEYELAKAGVVELRVYDIKGRRVKALASGKHTAGRFRVNWDGRDDGGRLLPTGIYFYRLDTGQFLTARKALLLR